MKNGEANQLFQAERRIYSMRMPEEQEAPVMYDDVGELMVSKTPLDAVQRPLRIVPKAGRTPVMNLVFDLLGVEP